MWNWCEIDVKSLDDSVRKAEEFRLGETPSVCEEINLLQASWLNHYTRTYVHSARRSFSLLFFFSVKRRANRRAGDKTSCPDDDTRLVRYFLSRMLPCATHLDAACNRAWPARSTQTEHVEGNGQSTRTFVQNRRRYISLERVGNAERRYTNDFRIRFREIRLAIGRRFSTFNRLGVRLMEYLENSCVGECHATRWKYLKQKLPICIRPLNLIGRKGYGNIRREIWTLRCVALERLNE